MMPTAVIMATAVHSAATRTEVRRSEPDRLRRREKRFDAKQFLAANLKLRACLHRQKREWRRLLRRRLTELPSTRRPVYRRSVECDEAAAAPSAKRRANQSLEVFADADFEFASATRHGFDRALRELLRVRVTTRRDRRDTGAHKKRQRRGPRGERRLCLGGW